MPKYSFEKNRLILIDPEFCLAVDEPFSPLELPKGAKHGALLPEGAIVLEQDGEFSIEKNGVRTGQYKILYPSGKIKVEAYYQEGLLHGPAYFFSETGQALATTWYIRGKKEGRVTLNYLSGALYSEQRFLHGLWEGEQLYYYPDGKLKSRLFFKAGRLHGKQKVYSKHQSEDR
jgi:MORN repeat variant